jgi:long-chain acyl-CoA synthetase
VNEHGGLKSKIFWWSFRVGALASRQKSSGKRMGPFLALRYAVAYRLVFAKLFEAVGGNLKYFISGGAPLAKRIAEFFDAAGILILEGWGATETSAPATWNTPEDYRFGSVGKPIPGVEVKVDGDGELLVRGPNVFREYWKMPDATRETIDPDGWYHTGDIGMFDTEGYVYITDRKKELIITAAGKNISPANIENLIKSSPYVSNVLAFGDRQKYITALVTLEQAEVTNHLRKMNINIPEQHMLPHMPEVRKLVEDEINRLNNDLARFEQIKEFRIIEKDFSIEDDLLTPTLKLKRKNIIARYKGLIESMYHDDLSKVLQG